MPPRTNRRMPHHGVFARIGRSRIHGVGVIAVRDIPAGTALFRGESERVRWVSRDAVRRLPPALRALYEDFGMVWGTRIGVPPTLNMLSVGWYLNHSDRPNVEADDDARFFALRDIRAGEELTADYRTFVDEPLAFRPRRARRSRGRPPDRPHEAHGSRDGDAQGRGALPRGAAGVSKAGSMGVRPAPSPTPPATSPARAGTARTTARPRRSPARSGSRTR